MFFLGCTEPHSLSCANKKNRIRHHAECGCKIIIKGAEKQDLGHYSCSYLFAEWGEVLRNRMLKLFFLNKEYGEFQTCMELPYI